MEFALLWCPLPAMDHKTYPKHGYIGLFKRVFGAIFIPTPNTGILGSSKEVLVQF
jgi:hypothetical protein